MLDLVDRQKLLKALNYDTAQEQKQLSSELSRGLQPNVRVLQGKVEARNASIATVMNVPRVNVLDRYFDRVNEMIDVTRTFLEAARKNRGRVRQAYLNGRLVGYVEALAFLTEIEAECEREQVLVTEWDGKAKTVDSEEEAPKC